MILKSDGPCRAASDEVVAWQVAHCCLNSAAPSGGVAAGSGICAAAIVAASSVPQHPAPVAHLARGFLIDIPVGRGDSRSRSTGGGSSGLFHCRTKAAVLANRFRGGLIALAKKSRRREPKAALQGSLARDPRWSR